MTAYHPRPVTYELLLGIVVIFALMLYAALHYPASLSHGGWVSFLATAGALLAYGSAAVLAQCQSSASLQIALGQGTKVGIFLGAVAVLNHVLEIFAALDSSVSAILGVSMWGLMFLVFGSAASATYHRIDSLRLAVVASVWCALVSTVATLLAGYAIAVLFMPRVQHILQVAYAQSRMTDPQAFVIQNTLNSGAAHMLLAPLMAVIFGFTSGVAGFFLASIRRGVAIALAVFALFLVVAGLAAIRHASLLNRPDRPPYIMFGLLALGITMATAHPVLVTIRRQAA